MQIANPVKKAVLISFLAILTISCGSDENIYRVVLGTTNILSKSSSGLQYQMPFVVQITNIEGTPASNVVVEFSVAPTKYHKGYYQATDLSNPADAIPDEWRGVYTASCDIEDVNINGRLDTGEDINGNGVLDPTNPATISAHPTLTPTINNISGFIQTDENGFGYFVMSYPPSEALWVDIKLTAIAAGNSEPEIYQTTLPVLSTDIADLGISPPGGVIGKYGNANVCTDPN